MTGDAVREKWFANRAQGGRAVGGRLTITRTHVSFRPNFFDKFTGGEPWEAALSAVAEVGAQAPTGGPFDGGLRKRLRITLHGGEVQLFVVNKLEDRIKILREAAGLS